VALGATAARSIFQRVVIISLTRGRPHRPADGMTAFVTIRPSYILRIEEEDDKKREFNAFVGDLRLARDSIA
jgi:uracil-DNA glycosylase